jgi:hypothetical protein
MTLAGRYRMMECEVHGKTLPQRVRNDALGRRKPVPHHGKPFACISGTGFSLSTPACGRIFSHVLRVSAPILE